MSTANETTFSVAGVAVLGPGKIRYDDLTPQSTALEKSVAAPDDETLQLMFTVEAVILTILSGFIFLVFASIVSSKKARSTPFNVYLLSLTFPDFVYTFSCAITCIMSATKRDYWSMPMCRFQSVYLVFGTTANVWLNAVITNEVHILLKSCRDMKHYKPPSRRNVGKKTLACYGIAATFGLLTLIGDYPMPTAPNYGFVCFPVAAGLESNLFLYLFFLPILVLIPFAYIGYVTWDIWKSNLLPKKGKRRDIAIYFFRIVAMMLLFWAPALILLCVATGSNYWLRWALTNFAHFQGAASATVSLLKSDVKESFINFIRCRCRAMNMEYEERRKRRMMPSILGLKRDSRHSSILRRSNLKVPTNARDTEYPHDVPCQREDYSFEGEDFLRGVVTQEEMHLCNSYKDLGMPFGDPIYSMKGDHWCYVAPALLTHTQNFRPTLTDFGYGAHAFGVQRHRDIATNLITQENDLSELNLNDEDFQVGVWSFSTRLCMFDYGRYIQKKRLDHGRTKTPLVVVPSPAWDYAGIFEELNFKVLYLPLEKQNAFEPNHSTWDNVMSGLDIGKEEVALVVVNTQHNPTGVQFTPKDVQYLFNIVLRNESAHLLMDDAYFAVHDPSVPMTNTLKIWLGQIDGSLQERWLYTRPFSKQLGCYAIPFAIISGSAKMLGVLDSLARNHSNMTGLFDAEMMTQFLQTDEYKECKMLTGEDILRRKQAIKRFFIDRLGYPENKSSVIVGPSSHFMLFSIPPSWQMEGAPCINDEIITDFRDQLFMSSGVLLSSTPLNGGEKLPYVRIYIGGFKRIIADALLRFEDCGLRWDMGACFPHNVKRSARATLLSYGSPMAIFNTLQKDLPSNGEKYRIPPIDEELVLDV